LKLLKLLRWVEARLAKDRTVVLIIAVAGLIAYLNSIEVPFILDDFGSISNNYAIHSLFDFDALWKFYANRIVLYFTLSLNYAVHDNGVEGYHVVNILIHIINGMLLYCIINRLLSLPYFAGKLLSRHNRLVSVSIALLFIVHPIQVNAVSYIVQRTAALAATFYFAAILFFIKYRMQDRLRHFILMMLFIILAMFTKENTITIPFMLLLIELFFFVGSGRTAWYKRIVIFLIIFATVPIIPGTNLFLKGYSQSDPGVSFKASTSMDRLQYFYTELNVVLFYIRLMFIPDRQNFDYSNDWPVSRTIWDNYSYLSFAVWVLIGLLTLFLIKRNRLAAFGILWFFIGLAVESTFISIKDVYFEHRLYFPCAGFLMFVAGMIFYEGKPSEAGRKRYCFKKPVLLFCVVTVICSFAYTGLTIKRNYVYSDSIRLWTDVVEKAPGSDRSHSVLGTSYLNAYDEKKKNTGYLDIAEREFKKAIEIYYSSSTAHTNLAKVYLLKGEYQKCIDEAQKSLNITKSEYAQYNIGSAYYKLGDTRESLEAYLAGYRINNRSTFILKALGESYENLKDYKNSIFYYEEYVKNNRGYDNSSIKKKIEELKKSYKKIPGFRGPGFDSVHTVCM
jgi:tetratricopeptide (TPR) repeat protein